MSDIQQSPPALDLSNLIRHPGGQYTITFCDLEATVNSSRTHINITNLATAYNNLKRDAHAKKVGDWLRLQSTNEIIGELHGEKPIWEFPPTYFVKDGPNELRGTYAPFELAAIFMAWLSHSYAIRMTKLMTHWELFKMTGRLTELNVFMRDFEETNTNLTLKLVSQEAINAAQKLDITIRDATIADQESALVIRDAKIANQEGLIEGQTRTIDLFRGLAEKAVMTVASATHTTYNTSSLGTAVGAAGGIGTMTAAGVQIASSLEALQRALPVASTPGPQAAEAAEQVIASLSRALGSLQTAYNAHADRAPVIPPPAQETYIMVSHITGAEKELFYVTRGQRAVIDRVRRQLDDNEIQIVTSDSGALEVRLVFFEGKCGYKQEYEVKKILEIRTSGATAILQRLREMPSFKNHTHGNWCDIDPCAEITNLCESAEFRGIVD